MAFGFNSEKSAIKADQKRLKEIAGSYIMSYEVEKMPVARLKTEIQQIHGKNPQLFELVISLIYFKLVTEHLSRIAIDDSLFKHLSKIYNEGNTNELKIPQFESQVMRDHFGGVQNIAKRFHVWMNAEVFWKDILTEVASNVGLNFDELLIKKGIKYTDGINHIIRP